MQGSTGSRAEVTFQTGQEQERANARNGNTIAGAEAHSNKLLSPPKIAESQSEESCAAILFGRELVAPAALPSGRPAKLGQKASERREPRAA